MKCRKCESTRLGKLTIRGTLKSARVHEDTLPHPLRNKYLKENVHVSADLPVNNWRRLNGNVLTNSGMFRFGGILTWGRFDNRKYTAVWSLVSSHPNLIRSREYPN